MFDIQTLMYGIIAAIFLLVLISGIILLILRQRQKKRKNFSLTVSGSDMSDISERLAERFRNERAKED